MVRRTRKRCRRSRRRCPDSRESANAPPGLTNPAAALGLTGHVWNSNGDGVILTGLVGDVVEGLTGSATVDGSLPMDLFNRWVSPARLVVTQMKDYFGLAHDLPKWASEGAEAAAKAAKALRPPFRPRVLAWAA